MTQIKNLSAWKKFPISLEYNNFLEKIKSDIKKSRNKAIISVNTELINLYFSIWKDIFEKQKNSNWWDDLIWQIEKDIKKDLPEIKWFSRRNINYMRSFYIFIWENKTMQQLVAQIPWGHICLILTKIKDKKEAFFYINKTVENSWSRTILDHQISLNLYNRQWKLQSNFEKTLPEKENKILQENFKKDYVLDFLNIWEEIKERDLEKGLIKNISDFLMEMWTGFAFVGKQYKIQVWEKEFFIDLLFYNYILKRFVIIELKITEFKPEHVWQLWFYMTAVDKNIKTESDKETIWLIICKTKDEMVVEYALNNVNKPTWIAEYKFSSELPNEIKNSLPNEEEIKNLLNF